MNTFIVNYAHDLVIGNVTRTIVVEAGGLVAINSTFGFTTLGSSYGAITGTVSARDLYTYSNANDAWLISQETWDFLTLNSTYLNCIEG
jgi:hypothetical protein